MVWTAGYLKETNTGWYKEFHNSKHHHSDQRQFESDKSQASPFPLGQVVNQPVNIEGPQTVDVMWSTWLLIWTYISPFHCLIVSSKTEVWGVWQDSLLWALNNTHSRWCFLSSSLLFSPRLDGDMNSHCTVMHICSVCSIAICLHVITYHTQKKMQRWKIVFLQLWDHQAWVKQNSIYKPFHPL